MADGGFLAFYGSPQDAKQYFKIINLSEIYSCLNKNSGRHWALRWSNHIQRDKGGAGTLPGRHRSPLNIQREKISTLQHFGIMIRHGRVVLQRIRALAIRDRISLIVMTLQPALVFLAIWLLFGEVNSGIEEMNVAFLLIVCTFWFGCSNSAKEIVKERLVFESERHAGLNVVGYLGAKALWLVGVTFVQSVVLFSLTKFATDLPLDFSLAILGIISISICGVALGLFISVLSKNTDVAASAVPLAVIPQVIIGGLLEHPVGLSEVIAKIGIPCYWGFGLFLSALTQSGNSKVNPSMVADLYSTESSGISLSVILVMAVTLLIVSALSLSGIKVGGELREFKGFRNSTTRKRSSTKPPPPPPPIRPRRNNPG